MGREGKGRVEWLTMSFSVLVGIVAKHLLPEIIRLVAVLILGIYGLVPMTSSASVIISWAETQSGG